MSVTRSNLIGGPCVAVYNAASFYAAGDTTLTIEATTQDERADMYGVVDESVLDAIARLSLTPFALWANMSTLYPTAFTNPTIGSRLFGDTDKALQIWSSNGDLYTVHNAAITRPPPLQLGPTADLFGAAEFTGLVKDGADMEDADSLYSIATGQASPASSFAKTNFSRQTYSAAWGTVAGFTSFQAEDNWTITCEPTLQPLQIQGRTVDYLITAVRWMASCKPVGPTGAQIEAAHKMQGIGNPQGHLLGANGSDLTITGSDGKNIVINNAVLKTTGYRFGSTVLRNGELGWVTAVEFVTGSPQALVTIT